MRATRIGERSATKWLTALATLGVRAPGWRYIIRGRAHPQLPLHGHRFSGCHGATRGRQVAQRQSYAVESGPRIPAQGVNRVSASPASITRIGDGRFVERLRTLWSERPRPKMRLAGDERRDSVTRSARIKVPQCHFDRSARPQLEMTAGGAPLSTIVDKTRRLARHGPAFPARYTGVYHLKAQHVTYKNVVVYVVVFVAGIVTLDSGAVSLASARAETLAARRGS